MLGTISHPSNPYINGHACSNTPIKRKLNTQMIGFIIAWLIILFALGSGASKLISIKIEQYDAEELSINYKFILAMGVLQLIRAPLFRALYSGGLPNWGYRKLAPPTPTLNREAMP